MKFKKGDRVRVKSNSRLEGGSHAGKPGVVMRIARLSSFPYRIKFDEQQFEIMFSGNELEKEE